jgi:hypothetical protein
MEYTIMGRIYPIIINNLIKEELKNHYKNDEIKDIIKNTKEEYIRIIKRTPNMGGNKNFYIGNMYLGSYLIGLYRNIKNKISLEEYNKMIQNGLKNSKILKSKMKRVNYLSKKYKAGLYKRMEWAKENKMKFPMNWQINIPKNKKNTGIYFEFTKCGLCELCKNENIMELTPLMCDTDYLSLSFANCKLIREKTLAKGNDCSDFWIIKKTYKNRQNCT